MIDLFIKKFVKYIYNFCAIFIYIDSYAEILRVELIDSSIALKELFISRMHIRVWHVWPCKTSSI